MPTTEQLSALNIHKLTQAQYDRESEAGRLDSNALYLTPFDGLTLGIHTDGLLYIFVNGAPTGNGISLTTQQ